MGIFALSDEALHGHAFVESETESINGAVAVRAPGQRVRARRPAAQAL